MGEKMPDEETAPKATRETGDTPHGLGKLDNQVALLIAVLALILAVNGVMGDNNNQEILQSEMKASDTWAFYQAKNIRRAATNLAKDQLALQVAVEGAAWPAAVREKADQTLAGYISEAERLTNEKDDGTEALKAKARGYEAQRDDAMLRNPNFGYAGALLQIAIVISSMSIVLKRRGFFWGGLAIGLAGGGLVLNGFLLMFQL